jgi:hypothetical protein
MKNPETQNLESLLASFSKTEQLRDDTEALKIRLESEVNVALDTGDALDEKTAQALQTKRGQIDLIPAKLAQISARLTSLTVEIQTEFDQRSIVFSRAIQTAGNVAKDKLRAVIIPMLHELQVVNGEEIVHFIFPRTKLANQLDGLESPIHYQAVNMQNPVAAARLLLASEKELASGKTTL